jgi:hypothetical protein
MSCVICNLALVCLEIVFVLVQDRCKVFCLMHHTLTNHFGSTRLYSKLKRFKWKLGLVCLEIVLIFMQDRCTVCMDAPYALKSIWTHPIELLDDVCHMESHFGPFGDSVSFGAR